MDEEEGEQFRIFHLHFLYSGWDEGKIVIWTPLDSKEKTRILISQHSSWMDSLSFSPDGRFLASTDFNRKLIIWSAEVNKKMVRIKRQWL
jgi:WD40 repeat protein